MIKALFLLSLLLMGCTFTRVTQIEAGAKGAKSSVHGKIESGTVVYKGTTVFNFGCKKVR